MKKFLLIATCTFLTSCNIFSTKRTNFIVPGSFEGIDEKGKTKLFHMDIEQISYEIYNSARGLNVIEDLVNGGYYKISLWSLLENGEKDIDYNFVNLKDAYNGEADAPISYKDDNYSWFTPFTVQNNKPLAFKDCYYSTEFYDANGVCTEFIYLFPIL